MTRLPNDWPEPWQHRTKAADPFSGYPGRGDSVKVLNGRDRHAGEVGQVRKVTFDPSGELLVTVRFDDGSEAEFWDDELLRKASK